MPLDLKDIQEYINKFEQQPQDTERMKALLDILAGYPETELTEYVLKKARLFNKDPRILQSLIGYYSRNNRHKDTVELLLADPDIPHNKWYRKAIMEQYKAMGLIYSASRAAGEAFKGPKIAVLIKRSADVDELKRCLAIIAGQSMPVERIYIAAQCKGHEGVKGVFTVIGTQDGIDIPDFRKELKNQRIEYLAVIDAAVTISGYWMEQNWICGKNDMSRIITNSIELIAPKDMLERWICEVIDNGLHQDVLYSTDYLAFLPTDAVDIPMIRSNMPDCFYIINTDDKTIKLNASETAVFHYNTRHTDALERNWAIRTKRIPLADPGKMIASSIGEPFSTFISYYENLNDRKIPTAYMFLNFEAIYWNVLRNVQLYAGERAFECMAIILGGINAFYTVQEDHSDNAFSVVIKVLLNDLTPLVDIIRPLEYRDLDILGIVAFNSKDEPILNVPNEFSEFSRNIGDFFLKLIASTKLFSISDFLRAVIDLRNKQVQGVGEQGDTVLLKSNINKSEIRKLECEGMCINGEMGLCPMFRQYRIKVHPDEAVNISFLSDADYKGIVFQAYVQNDEGVNNVVYRSFNLEHGLCESLVPLDGYSGQVVMLTVILCQMPITLLNGQFNKEFKSKEIVFRAPYILRRIKQPRNVLLISLDAVRADFLGCYGNKQNVTMNLDKLADDSAVFNNAYSQTYWTLPSHMCMLASQYVSQHELYMDRKLKSNVPLVSRYLKAAGYQTYGHVSHIRLAPSYGYARSFDNYILDEKNSASYKIQETIKYLDRNRAFNNFLFLHYFDVHSLYMPGNNISLSLNPVSFRLPLEKSVFEYTATRTAPDPDVLEYIRNEYSGELWELDLALGNLFGFLKTAGLYENSLIIVTADHGEEFREHGSFFHDDIYNEVLHVPLIIKFPEELGVGGSKVANMVHAGLDIAPTINDVVFPERHVSEFQGKSLLPYASGYIPCTDEEYVISEMIPYNSQKKYRISWQTKRYKYIYTTVFETDDFRNFRRNQETHELYDLSADPGENKNIAPDYGELTGSFNDKVMAFINANLERLRSEVRENVTEIKHDEIIRARLEALGYI